MSTIDDRVVEMQFDNKQFNRGIADTVKALGNLKKNLKFEESVKSIGNLEKKINGINLSTLASNVQTIANRFSTLGVIATTALQNITNAAVNTGKQLLNALTLEPISAGFSEYELQMRSIQTILNNTKSKGSTLEDVNGALNELNEYADQTIYNFSQMTQNIGRFTAAGVDLQTSVDSIKGLSNLAAFFGSDANQAASAMYQLSQAIAAGRVQLMDWNSVVNAGMGGPEFQNALIRTAEHFGTNVDGMIERYGSFRESLTRGQWLTADVLTETLKQISGAYSEADLIAQGYTESEAKAITQLAEDAETAATKVRTFTQLMSTIREAMGSGWTQSWQIIQGDFLEATDNWSGLYEKLASVIQKSADDRNQLLTEWADLGGRTELWAGINAMFDAFLSYASAIKKGFEDIFPPATAQQLYDFTKGFHDFWKNAILSTEATEKLSGIVSDFASVLKWVIDGVTGAADGLAKMADGAGLLGDGIFDFVKSFSGFLRSITEGIDLSGGFSLALSLLGDTMSGVGRILSFLGSGISILATAISGALGTVTSGVSNLMGGLGTASQGITEILIAFIQAIPEATGAAISAIGDAVSTILDSVPIHEVNAAIQDTLFTLILGNINKFVKGLGDVSDPISNVFKNISDAVEKMGEVLDTAKGSIKSFAASIKATTLLQIAMALGILAISIKTLASIPIDQVASSLGALAGGMVIMGAAGLAIIAILKKMSGGLKGALEIASLATTLRKIAVSMLLFAASIKVLSSALETVSGLSWDQIFRGLVAIAGLTGVVIAATKLLDKTKGLIKTSVSLIIFAGAISILANALHSMSSLGWDNIIQGLAAIAGSAAILVVATKLMDKGATTFIRSSIILLMFSASIRVMAEAMKAFSKVEPADILKSVGALAGLMTVMKLFSKTMSSIKIGSSLSVVALLLAYSVALESFAKVAVAFNDIDVSAIGKMSLAVGALMAELAIFSRVLGKKKNLLEIAGGIWLVVDALNGLTDVFVKFGTMRMNDIVKGLIGIAGGLGLVLAAMKLMPENTIDDTIMFLAVALSLKAMANAVKEFGSMDIESIGRALLAFAGSLTIMAVAAHALKGTAGGSGSLALFALALSLLVGPIKMLGDMRLSDIGKALIGLAASLTVVGVASSVLGKMSGAILKTAGSLIVMGAAITVFGIGLTAIIYPIKQLAGLDSSELSQGVLSLAAVIGTLFALVNTMNALPDFSVKTIAKVALMALVISGVGAVIGQLAALDAASALQAAGALSGTLLATVVALKVLDTVKLSGAVKGVATLAVIIAGMGAVVAAAGGIAQIPGAKWLIGEGTAFLASIGQAIGGFFGSLIGGVAGGAISAVGASLPGFGQAMSEFATSAQPFFSIISTVKPESFAGIGALATAILALTAANVVESATAWLTGGNTMVQFGQQLAEFAPYLMQYSNTISGIDAASVQASGVAAKALAEFATAIPNEGGLIARITGENDIVQFGQKLALFGPYFRMYAASVSGLDGEAVTNSANAAKAMAEFASNLPNEGGLLAKIMGENDIVQFGQKLAEFGPSLQAYAQSVAGLDGDVVLNSANAAKALAEVANNIPADGGGLQWLVGSRDLGSFGTSLGQLGEGMKKYGDQVAGIDPAAVSSSASAAQSLVNVANSLQNSGGALAFFTGEQDLAGFGENLAFFGDGLKSYGDKVSGIDPAAVETSAIAAQSLVTLSNSLANSGSFLEFFTGEKDLSGFGESLPALGEGIAGYAKAVADANFDNVSVSATALQTLSTIQSSLSETGGVSGWWSGDQDLTGFAGSLESLGTSISAYAGAVADTSFENVSASVTAVNQVKDAIVGMAGMDTSGITTMTEAITNVQNMGLDGFNEAMTASAENAATAMTQMETSLSEGSSSISTSFETIRTNLTTQPLDFTSVGNGMASSLISGITSIIDESGISTFREKGRELIEAIKSGIDSRRDSLGTLCRNILDDCASALSNYSKFYNLGVDIINGLSNGISENRWIVQNAASRAAADALTAAKAALDSNSPSKKFQQLGFDSVLGLANGFSYNSSIAEHAASDMANRSLNAVQTTMKLVSDLMSRGDLLELHPTISPVLDLSNMSNGRGRINKALSKTRGLTRSISTGLQANKMPDSDVQNGSPANGPMTVSFTQNNYSPKALSRIDIYRDTKNQLSRMRKGL